MEKVLVVDDEADVRQACVRYLSTLNYQCLEAKDGIEGLRLLVANDDCRIVLTDVSMPGMDGLTMISKGRKQLGPSVQFVVFTGKGDKETVLNALRLGVTEFLEKPMSWADVLSALRRAQQELEKFRSENESGATAPEVQRELDKTRAELVRTNRRVARQLALIGKFRDDETAEHCERVGMYARRLAELAGAPTEFCDDIVLAAILHDIGKVGVPDAILSKPGKLSDAEFQKMRMHTTYGAKMLAEHRDNPILAMAYEIALGHHERWDGTGYPDRLSGPEIPLSARFCAIADVYDALRTARPYKPAYTHRQAVNTILNGDDRTRPAHFDPELLRTFARHHKEFDEIHRCNPDKAPAAY